MNIRNWPMNRIMQLPDYCFGRRFIVSAAPAAPAGGAGWDISEIALPERFVIWEFFCWWINIEALFLSWRLALGDILPTTIAEMDALQPLFPGLGVQGAEPRALSPLPYRIFMRWQIRQSVVAAGRRLVAELTSVPSKQGRIQVAIVVSSIPTEVPEWLISGTAKSL